MVSEIVAGRVVSWATSTRLAQIEGIPGTVPVLRHVVSIAINDTAVVMVQAGQRWVVGVLGTAPPPPPPPPPTPAPDDDAAPPAPPAPAPVETVLRPIASGTYRGGSWRSDTEDLYQGDYTGRGINVGGCWWGALPSSLSAATLTLRRLAGAGLGAAQAPTMTLLAGTTRPAGAPTVLASVAGPALLRGATADWTVPAAWITRLASGEAGGIGITSAGSRTPYLGLAASGAGMTLTITS